MSFTYLVGVFRQGTKQPLINVTVAEVDSSNVILNSAKTNSAGFAIIQPSDEEFIPKVLVSGNYVHDVDVIITGLGAGVGPFEYDYLVDKNWADVVASGRGSEGQVIPTFHGHTFRVYSTVGAAITDGISRWGRAFSIIVVGRSDGSFAYPEALTIPSHSHEIHIYGTGKDSTIIGSAASGNHVFEDEVFLYDLTLDASSRAIASNSGASFTIHARNCRFRDAVGGDHTKSQFIDCQFDAGWSFEATDTPSSVKIFGGEITAGNIDFSTCSQASGWDVRGLILANTSKIVIDNVTDMRFDVAWGATLGDAIVFSGGNSQRVDIKAKFPGPSNGAAVVRIASSITARSVSLKGVFSYSIGISSADTRFVLSEGIAEGWHIDTIFDKNGSGNHIEDDGAKSVSGVFVDSKFTLVPPTAEINTTTGSSGNVVDSGVINSGSIGIDYASPGEHEHTGTGDGGNTLQPTNYKLPAATELTINTGAITVTQSHHTIDTEADAASDDLDTINGLVANQLYVLRPANDARTIKLKHGTGNISCVNGADLTLDDVEDFVWALSTDGSAVYVLFDTQGAGSVDAADVTYTPLVLTDWDLDADPGNVDDALDQLAERVDDVEDAAGHAADEIIDVDGDTKVQVEEGADDDTIRFDAGGAEVAQIKNGGLFIANDQGQVVGHTSQIAAGGTTPEFQILGNQFADRVPLIGAFSATVLGAGLAFTKSRSGTIGTNTIVQDGDIIGTLEFYPADGVDFDTQAALFRAVVEDASPAAGDIGMGFVWALMPGDGSALRDVMHLHPDGNLHLHDTASLYLHEKSAADADDAGAGQLWVLSNTPNELYFTDDAGNDKRIDAIPIDISFVFEADALATGVFVAPHGIAADLLALLTNANVTDANAFVYAETAGTGTNTILIETTSTNPWTGSPTWATVATLNLGTAKRATAAFSGTYNPTTQYLRARCSAVGGTAPQKVHARISALGVVA